MINHDFGIIIHIIFHKKFFPRLIFWNKSFCYYTFRFALNERGYFR